MEIAFTPPDSDAAVDWALAYAAASMAVFPVKADKKPLTIHGFRDAVVDETQIRAWWRMNPHADIGWAVPAEVVVVDLDNKSGGDGFKDFMAREGAHPDARRRPRPRRQAAGAISSTRPTVRITSNNA